MIYARRWNYQLEDKKVIAADEQARTKELVMQQCSVGCKWKKHTDNKKTQIEKLARKYLLVFQNMLFDFIEAGKNVLNIFWKIWIYM